MKLEGTIGILTGASRGLGAVLAEELALRGVTLALAARGEADLKETVARVEGAGGKAIAVPTDVTKRGDIEALFDRTTAELGPVDLLVNNAGVHMVSRFEVVEIDEIERLFLTNVISSEILTRLVLPGMIERRKGHVVCISSISGKYAAPYFTIYSSTKHALVGFCWSLREEMRPYGVGVSVVCPGTIGGVGMWHDDIGDRVPRTVNLVPPEKVAAETITSIEKNRAEVIVSPGFAKFGDVVQAISPDLASLLPRRNGTYEFLRREAERDHPR